MKARDGEGGWRERGLAEPAAAFEREDLPAAVATERSGPRPAGELSFEEALAELEGLVQKLERGQLDLDSAIAAYERGSELRQHCATKLREAELRVEKLSLDRAGNAKLAPLDGP